MKGTLSPALKLALMFLVFGICWVLFSDAITLWFTRGNLPLYNTIQHYKGLLLVLIFTILIYLVCRTLYKKQEETLQRYRILGMATRDAIWDFNLFTQECYTNRMVQELFGYNEEELRDNYSWWTNNLHPEDRERVLGAIDSVLHKGGSVWQDEYRFRCKDGQYKIIFDRGFIMRTSQGIPYRLLGAMQDVTKKRELQQQLIDDELRHQQEMAVNILQAEEAERKKLAEELHDNINQLLGVVKLYLQHSRVNPAMREELLEKGGEYIEQVIEEIRRLSRTLLPPALKSESLLHCIREMIESIQEVKEIRIKLQVDHFDEQEIPENKRLMLYRIIQEQLNNILKHADAEQVTIRLSFADGHITLSVSDNGVGFDMLQHTSGMGLKNIRNRVEVFNGYMEIASEPGKGCTLVVELDA